MKTFDLAEVRCFAADLDARMDRCDSGEGMECANLDDTLRYYATLCCEFRDGVRQWGRAVFAGQVAFDPEVERVWLEKGNRLLIRAVELLENGQVAEEPCYTLDGLKVLRSALWDLDRLLEGWVTPQLAVGPSARQERALDSTTVEKARQRIASLPPLSANWRPADPRQQRRQRTAAETADVLTARHTGVISWLEPPWPTVRRYLSRQMPIEVRSPEFDAISGWPFADSFVLRLLRDDIPQRVQFGAGRQPDHQELGVRHEHRAAFD